MRPSPCRVLRTKQGFSQVDKAMTEFLLEQMA